MYIKIGTVYSSRDTFEDVQKNVERQTIKSAYVYTNLQGFWSHFEMLSPNQPLTFEPEKEKSCMALL